MSTTYLPGRDVAVVRDGAWALLPQAAADAAVPLWEAWADTPSVTATIDVLAGRFGLDLATLPAFAAVTLSGSGDAHVLVRGDFRVRCVRDAGAAGVAGSAEEMVVDGVDASTWHERRATGVSAIVVTRAGEVVADGSRWPVREAVLTASLLSVTTGGTVRDHAASSASASAAAPSAAAPSAVVPDAAPVPPAPVPPAPVPPAPAPPARVETLLPGSATIADPFPEPDPSPGGGAGAEPDGYAHLWGETVARSVEDAAVRLAEDGSVLDPETQAEPAEDDSADDRAEDPATDDPSVDDEPEPEPAPGAPAPVSPPAGHEPAAEVLADDDDSDDHTVMGGRSAVLRAQAAQAAPALAGPEMVGPAADDGPQVPARTCPAGHVNPPARDTCRECGAGIEGDTLTAARPSLGRVVVSDGPTLDLDRPLVVGRRPRSPRAGAHDMPRLVTVPSPQNDISRSHVAVALDGWQVLVSDLTTTNGTELLRQEQAPRRLHPGEPTPLVDGDVVDLGDGVTLTFEGLW